MVEASLLEGQGKKEVKFEKPSVKTAPFMIQKLTLLWFQLNDLPGFYRLVTGQSNPKTADGIHRERA